jgi:hypothetical protein
MNRADFGITPYSVGVAGNIHCPILVEPLMDN